MLALTESFTLQALRNEDHLHIFYCSSCHLPEHRVLALQEGPVLSRGAEPPQRPGRIGVGDVSGAERASCSSEGRSGKEGRDWGWGEAEVGDGCTKAGPCRNMQGASVCCMRVKVHHGCALPLTL